MSENTGDAAPQSPADPGEQHSEGHIPADAARPPAQAPSDRSASSPAAPGPPVPPAVVPQIGRAHV